MSAYGCCGAYNEHAKDCVTRKLEAAKAEIRGLRDVVEILLRFTTPIENKPQWKCKCIYEIAREALQKEWK